MLSLLAMAHLLTAAGGADVQGSRRVHSAKNVINDSLDANYYVSLGERGQAKRRIANVFCGGTIVTGRYGFGHKQRECIRHIILLKCFCFDSSAQS